MKRKRIPDKAPFFEWKSHSGSQLARPSLLLPLIVIGFFLVIGIARVHFKTQNILVGYQLSKLEADRYQRLDEQTMLEVEKASLIRLERIEELAISQGMVYPAFENRIFIKVNPEEGISNR